MGFGGRVVFRATEIDSMYLSNVIDLQRGIILL
jgi:hypothetical protein